jgi:hypothetical protein
MQLQVPSSKTFGGVKKIEKLTLHMTKSITSQILESERQGKKMVLQGQVPLFVEVFKARRPSRSST